MAQSYNADQVAAHEKTTWDRCASIYEATLVPLTQTGYTLVAETGLIGPGKRILDVGCGPGVFTARYARVGAEVVGIDFSEQMIRIAKDQFPQIDFRVADVERLPFADDTFDVVVGVHVVHHLARPRVMFESVCRVTKPGGRFAFSVPDQLRQKGFGSFFSAVAEHHKMEAMPGGPLLMESDPAPACSPTCHAVHFRHSSAATPSTAPSNRSSGTAPNQPFADTLPPSAA